MTWLRSKLRRAWRWLGVRVRMRVAICQLRARSGQSMVLGFYLNRREVLAAAAVRPDASLVRFNFLRRGRGLSHAERERFLDQVARITAGTRPTVICWGIRDRTNGHDLGEVFPEVVRVETSLLRGPHHRRLRTGFMMDRTGIYFDGRSPSETESELQALPRGYAARSTVALRMLEHVRHSHVTMYVLADSSGISLVPGSLLILGQVNGDQAIKETLTVAASNLELVQWICANRPVPDVSKYYYKPHPRNRRDNDREIAEIRARHPDVQVIHPEVNVHKLFEGKPKVATMTSGAGLEAALHGCEVHTFGTSFYSNFGFTVDHFDCPRRTNRLSAEDVASFMWLDRTVYVDPRTRKPVSAESVFGLNFGESSGTMS